jgi:hypothetical protein
MSDELTDRDLREAVDRIARTADGIYLYRYLQKVLCAITSETANECALRRNEGRRSFAAELMGLMAEGLRDSGSAADTPVTFALAGARSVARPHGAARRVTADTFVSGWDGADADSSPGTDPSVPF